MRRMILEYGAGLITPFMILILLLYLRILDLLISGERLVFGYFYGFQPLLLTFFIVIILSNSASYLVGRFAGRIWPYFARGTVMGMIIVSILFAFLFIGTPLFVHVN